MNLRCLAIAIILVVWASLDGTAQQSRIVVRIADPSLLALWNANGRTGSLPVLEPLLGYHSTTSYISPEVLQAAHHRLRNRQQHDSAYSAQQADSAYRAIQAIASICIVEYTTPIPPPVLVAKLQRRKEFVYVEEMPIYQLLDITNDPLSNEQYYLSLINAVPAWSALPSSGDPIIVGVVDTGIDTAHADLRDNIARNAGEVGVDNLGRDKRFNRVDDDNNGFVDDWFGWDFVGSDGASPDNTPLPGNSHGTHVAGIIAAHANNSIGIAGVAQNVKVLPVKVGRDAPGSRTVENTGNAIVYAASVGARIINCSFGSASQSFASLDVVRAATSLGALIVAAAGNDASEQAFYPAAHDVVLSVAATDAMDRRAMFSNFHRSVDICAPGVGILSTIPNNSYELQDGTSMASPIVAAVAAMTLFANPTLAPDQLRGLIKANAVSIDSLNPTFEGRLGSGRVDALASVTRVKSKIAEIPRYTIHDDNQNGILEPGESVEIQCAVTSQLDALQNAVIVVSLVPQSLSVELLRDSVYVGKVASGMTITPGTKFMVRIPTDAAINANMQLLATIYDGTEVCGQHLLEAIVNPNYRTVKENNIAVTVTTTGTVGFNDYPANTQGVGLVWKDTENILFEGALMLGSSPTYLPNAARGADPRFRDHSFRSLSIVEMHNNIPMAIAEAVGLFSDDNDRYKLNVNIKHTVLQPTSDSVNNTLILVYDITNPSDTSIRDMYASLFFDWDIGLNGELDGVAWDNQRGLAVAQNTENPELPTVCVGMISDLPLNVAAMDNQGGGGIPSIYDNFIRAEKWNVMSKGKLRTNSSITDVSMAIGGGPFDLGPKQSQQIAFVIAVDKNLSSASAQARSARHLAVDLGLNAVPYVATAEADRIEGVTPSPVYAPHTIANVRFHLSNPSEVNIQVVDLVGRPLLETITIPQLPTGPHAVDVRIPHASTGTYFIILTTRRSVLSHPIQIVP